MASAETEMLIEMGASVYEMAETIFAECGFASDFCWQTGMVFGGTNRIWLNSRGWVADRSYCNPDFLASFDNLMAEKNV